MELKIMIGSPMANEAGDTLSSRLVTLRRWFHQHPELSFEEADTAQRIITELGQLGIPYQYEGVGHAVIGRISGVDPTRMAIGLRADMDALPGKEATGASYASVHEGKVHACGHDAHMAMLIGAAGRLARQPPPGPVNLIFQPAEEKGGGAKTAIADGALLDVAAIFAVHVTHEYVTGHIMARDGAVTSQSDRFRVHIRGRGGHGARPHEAIDSVVVAGFFITALQTLVSRETNPFHPAVVTIGKIRAGSAPNVIAAEAKLEGTIRTSRPEVREHIFRGLERMIGAAADLHNAEIDIEFEEGYPPVINHPYATTVARSAARATVGGDNVVSAEYPSMGSEDFSFYLKEKPGAFVRLGARKPHWEATPLHSPLFDIDEGVLPIGASYFERVARLAHEQIERFDDGL